VILEQFASDPRALAAEIAFLRYAFEAILDATAWAKAGAPGGVVPAKGEIE
jgi:hypothetical protein